MAFTVRVVLLAATAASLALMYRAGHRNPSVVLMLVFTVWVASPFVALDAMNNLARRWSQQVQTTLRIVALVIAVGSVGVYGIDALRPLWPKAAFPYLVVPLTSWLVIAGALALAKSRK